ncbi:MAG: diguanylate cyclase [Leptospirales bacterium]|nr:diguanylate cyclase [Leptospirales bacterium]
MRFSVKLKILVSAFIFFSVSSFISILIFTSAVEKYVTKINMQTEYNQIMVDAETDRVKEISARMLFTNIALVLLTIIAAIVSFIIITKKISSIYKLTEIAKEISKGDLNISIESEDDDEFGDLARSFAGMLDSIKVITTDLNYIARIDALTQIPNRHSFFLNTPSFFDFHARLSYPVALLFFDIDDFKKVNDNYGHAFGDEVLKNFAVVVSGAIRSFDLLCRYGGEEFIVLLSNTDQINGLTVAKRIMNGIERASFPAKPGFKYTTSIGLYSGIPKRNEKVEEYIDKADQTMYIAKKNGKNRIEVYRD